MVQDVLDFALTHCSPEPFGPTQVEVDARRVNFVACKVMVSRINLHATAVAFAVFDFFDQLLDCLPLRLACNNNTVLAADQLHFFKVLLNLRHVESSILCYLVRLAAHSLTFLA